MDRGPARQWELSPICHEISPLAPPSAPARSKTLDFGGLPADSSWHTRCSGTNPQFNHVAVAGDA